MHGGYHLHTTRISNIERTRLPLSLTWQARCEATLTPEVISKVVTSSAGRIRVKEDHLVLHPLQRVGRGLGGVTGVWVSIDDEPEVGSDPLVDKLLALQLDQLSCTHKQTHR